MNTIKQKGEWRFPVENSLVRDNTISIGARLLYIIIKGFAGPDCDLPFPSLDTLARHMGKNRKSVQKYLRELEKTGLLERQRPRAGGRFQSTRFLLHDRRHIFGLPKTGLLRGTNSKSKAKEAKAAPFQQAEKAEAQVLKPQSELNPPRPSKSTQLAVLKFPKTIPTENEFNAFVENAGDEYDLHSYRDLYRDLYMAKWHRWDKDAKRWCPIRDWQRYVMRTMERIKAAKEHRRPPNR